MDFKIILAIIAVVIIISLAFYIGVLTRRIQTLKAIQQQAIQQQQIQRQLKRQQRNANICESIRLIAHATTQKQCNLSEAAIRLTVLLETLDIDNKIDIEKEYPALSTLFNKVKDMPTHDARKKIVGKKLKMLDRQRNVFENELEESIVAEAIQLKTFSV
ncbi:DUF2489 domain-containing protein [Psychromonas sp. MME2]|uniref:DUF2489 domain-containing protein n=1 Tax=unclassified Psychromonas TaxID=2614957 RepID=UPI00339C3EE4